MLKISCFFTWVLRCNVVLKINIAGNWCIWLLKVSENVAVEVLWTYRCGSSLNMWLTLEFELCSNVVQCVLSSLGLAFLFFMLADSVMLCCHIAFEESLNMLMMMLEFELPCKSGLNLLCLTNFSSRKCWRNSAWKYEDIICLQFDDNKICIETHGIVQDNFPQLKLNFQQWWYLIIKNI